MAEENRLTKEDFKEVYEPMLDQIAGLIITHQEIPEEVDQSELLAAINLCKAELEQTLENRVAEINTLQQQIATKDRQVKKLQETNQQLFLKLGSQTPQPDPTPQPQRKTFAEIGALINNLPG